MSCKNFTFRSFANALFMSLREQKNIRNYVFSTTIKIKAQKNETTAISKEVLLAAFNHPRSVHLMLFKCDPSFQHWLDLNVISPNHVNKKHNFILIILQFAERAKQLNQLVIIQRFSYIYSNVLL